MRIPTAGFADVEAAILRTPTNGAVDAAATKKYLTPVGTLDQIWTMLLTKNAYYALAGGGGLYLAVRPGANAPSLSREEIAGLLSGNIVNWSQLGVTSPADDNVYLCRRDFGSGTEASFESEYLNERCSSLTDANYPVGRRPVRVRGRQRQRRPWLPAGILLGRQHHAVLRAGHPPPRRIPGYNTPVPSRAASSRSASTMPRLTREQPLRAPATPSARSRSTGRVRRLRTFRTASIRTSARASPTRSAPVPACRRAIRRSYGGALLAKLGHPAFTAISNSGYTGVLPWSTNSTTGDASPAGLYLATNPLTTIPSTSAFAATNPTNVFTKSSSGSVNNCDTPVFDTGSQSHTTPESKLLGTAHGQQLIVE